MDVSLRNAPLGLVDTCACWYRLCDCGLSDKVTGNTAVHDPTMSKDESGMYFVSHGSPSGSVFEISNRTWYHDSHIYRSDSMDFCRFSLA